MLNCCKAIRKLLHRKNSMELAEPGILLILGIAVSGGILSAVLIKRLSIPQVLGYLVMGIIIGESGFKLVTRTDIQTLAPFNSFALGIIGFLVGSEIRFETFKKYGRQFSSIMLSEGLFAFVLVSTSISAIIYFLFKDLASAVAAGIVFGAIASATDPASTINVLWEYRSAGILTTTLVAIVALDDALAMTLYGIGSSMAQMLTGTDISVTTQVVRVVVDLGGSLTLGFAAGMVLNFLLHRSRTRDYMFSLAVGVLLLCIGIAVMFHMDVILAAMAAGITVANSAPRRSRDFLGLMQSFSTPIYILFFVLVGARLGISSMPLWLWVIIGTYVLCRSVGKVAGAFIGARISRADRVVQKNTGLGLFAQGGVAVGLSIMASEHLRGVNLSSDLAIGDVIIFGVTATTFIVQIAGPPLVKIAIKHAGEIGKKITEEDVIAGWKVEDVTDKDVYKVNENAPLSLIFTRIPEAKYNFFPVIGENEKVVGLVTFEEIKDIVLDQSSWEWLVASDVMVPVRDYFYLKDPLADALRSMQQLGIEQAPIFDGEESQRPAGVLDTRRVKQKIRQYLVEKGAEPLDFEADTSAN
jgi:Kef-type K+ transport system membrane component KefB